MRKSYSITGVGAGRGLRGCTQDARAGMPYQPSSRRRPGSPVARASATRSYVRPRDWEGCHGLGLLRTVTVLARPPGLRAAEPGLGPLKNLGEPTAAGGRNLGLRRFRRRRLRQRGSRTMREPFGRPVGEFRVNCTSADHRSPRGRSWPLLRSARAASALMDPRSKSFIVRFFGWFLVLDYNLANRTPTAHR